MTGDACTPTSTSGSDPAQALVDFIANQGMTAHMLALHTPNGRDECRACGGPESGRHSWPCSIRLAAEAAQRGEGRPL